MTQSLRLTIAMHSTPGRRQLAAAVGLVFGGLSGCSFVPAPKTGLEPNAVQVGIASDSRSVRSVSKPEVSYPVPATVSQTAATTPPSTLAPSLAPQGENPAPPVHTGVANWKLPTGKSVKNVETIRCHIENGWPVIAIRSMDEENVWYIQTAAVPIAPEEFACDLVFGNDKTPSGTKFQAALIITRDATDAVQFTTGAMLRELPRDRAIAATADLVRE